MTAAELAHSAATDPEPPAGLTAAVRALWFAKAGRWDAAHDLCQKVPASAGSWIHAYLHREEGDECNARYWYSRAGRSMVPQSVSLAQEWLEIAGALLGDDG